MKASHLNILLEKKISAKSFAQIIDLDAINYENGLKKVGSTINLNLDEDEMIKMDSNRFKLLLESVIDGDLTNVHLAYLCDCLTLVEDSIPESLSEVIFGIADPEINGGLKSTDELKMTLGVIGGL